MHWGAGYDRHGQNATAAAVQAVQRATENVTMPGVVNFVPDGFDGLKVKVSLLRLFELWRCHLQDFGWPKPIHLQIKIGVPAHESVDQAAVKKVRGSTLVTAAMHVSKLTTIKCCAPRPSSLQSQRMWA